MSAWPVPAPVWPAVPEGAAGLPPAELDELAYRMALADVRAEGYIGYDHDRMLVAGVPYRGVVGEWTLATWPASTDKRRDALEKATWFAHDYAGFVVATGKTGLGFAGQAGRGKSGLAIAIAWELMGLGVPTAESAARSRVVRFVSWSELVARVTATVRSKPGSETVDEILAPLLAAEVLIVDDLAQPGQEPLTRWQSGILQQLVWPRYDDRTPMIVTTNLSSAEMERQLGDPIVSRLYGMLKWLPLDGGDERRKAVQA